MKRGVVIAACAVVLAVGIVLPLGLQGAPAPEEAARGAVPFAQTELPASDAAGAGQDASAGSGEAETADERGALQSVREPSGVEYRPGVVLVSLRDDVAVDQVNERLAGLDYIATKSVSEKDVAFDYVELALAEGVSVKDAESRIAEEDIVSAAQPNYVYRLLESDEATPSLVAGVIAQAAAINDARRSEQWALEAVNAYDAWETATADRAVTVAVIDNGCQTTHEDLKNNIVATYNAVSKSPAVTSSNGSHGTHVCGIVAAEANNGVGVAGVSYNAGLLPINVFKGDTADTAELLEAYDFILKHADEYNIRVANMSLGMTVDASSASDSLLDKDDRALKAAVVKAYQKDILTVCSAGNDVGNTVVFGKGEKAYEKKISGAYVNYPSDWLDCAIGVIASSKNNERASYSNYNMSNQTTKDITAPGGDGNNASGKVLSSIPYDERYPSRIRYGYMSGTSMAAPCVSGIAALVFAANPYLTAEQVAGILCSTAQDIGDAGWDRATGHGLIDAAASVKAAKAKKVIIGSMVSLLSSGFTYNGKVHKPDVAVKVGGSLLKKGTDYEVTYPSSSYVNAGTSAVTVKGIGDYAGTVTKTFKIAAKKVTPTVALATTSYVYNGNAKKPGVTVKVNGKKLASSGYTTTYASGRKAVGKYAVRVTLRGNYSGTKTAYFKINPNKTTLSSVSVKGRTLTAKWKRQAAQTTGYQVQWSLKSDFSSGNGSASVAKNSTLSKKTPTLKAKKKYYIRVRTYKTVNGVKYYSAWSDVKSAITKS